MATFFAMALTLIFHLSTVIFIWPNCSISNFSSINCLFCFTYMQHLSWLQTRWKPTKFTVSVTNWEEDLQQTLWKTTWKKSKTAKTVIFKSLWNVAKEFTSGQVLNVGFFGRRYFLRWHMAGKQSSHQSNLTSLLPNIGIGYDLLHDVYGKLGVV